MLAAVCLGLLQILRYLSCLLMQGSQAFKLQAIYHQGLGTITYNFGEAELSCISIYGLTTFNVTQKPNTKKFAVPAQLDTTCTNSLKMYTSIAM